MKNCDTLIIGSGIMGLSLARALKSSNPDESILIIDKEDTLAAHASSRNSGVLHAGFYYTADSFKAKFTVDGNRLMTEYCLEKGLPINQCGKLVVAQNEEELEQLYELEKRGQRNGSTVSIIDQAQAKEIEPNIKTFQKALHSPNTSSIDPKLVNQAVYDELVEKGVAVQLSTKYLGCKGHVAQTDQSDITFKRLINAAGLYADKIAKNFGFGQQTTMIPFKGLYLKYTKNKTDVVTNIYPVPNLKNPFLGVHFTKTVDGSIKIGPTAIPALWRENYAGLKNFKLDELFNVSFYESKLLLTNAFHFRDLAHEEMKKYNKRYFIDLACQMVQSIDPAGFTEFTKPGIRAQLLDTKTLQLVQDFRVEGDDRSLHILNAVSPAYTCAFAFADYILQNHLK